MPEDMRRLVDELNRHGRLYYENDAPEITDAEYDALYDALLKLEKETGVVLEDSPTRRVGGEPLKEFESVAHRARLWSLDKCRSMNELTAWAGRAEKLRLSYIADTGTELPPLRYTLEYKFDGLTVNATYTGGKLVRAATRGTGVTGEDVTQQILTIRSLPLTIPFTGSVDVQGECIMRLSVLEQYNKTAAEPLKNARNAAAGALRNLDPKVTASRHLDVFFYSIGFLEGADMASQQETAEFIKNNGLPGLPLLGVYDDVSQIEKEIARIAGIRNSLDFLIDGLVVKIDDISTREALGSTEKFPRWAMAYKFEAETAETTVLDITWEVGRTGKLTPLAHLEPVELAGATIRRATLNNIGDIEKKGVSVGARVILRRSNDVIPEILTTLSAGTAPAEPPKVCPACGAHTELRGAHLFCTNGLSCKPQITAALAHFASRDAMDIEMFSSKTAEALIEKLGIGDIAALYRLKTGDLQGLEGFGQKREDKLLSELEASKTRPLAAFIYALGIPNVGAKTARDLAERFQSFDALQNADAASLTQIDEVGDIIAQSIVDYFADPRIQAQITELFELGISPVFEQTQRGGAFEGVTFVLTGTLEHYDRKTAEGYILALGGKASSSVSRKTGVVLAGEAAGSKLEKALALGVRVMGEAEFTSILREQNIID